MEGLSDSSERKSSKASQPLSGLTLAALRLGPVILLTEFSVSFPTIPKTAKLTHCGLDYGCGWRDQLGSVKEMTPPSHQHVKTQF